MSDKFVADISEMSMPGQIILVLVLIQIVNIYLSKYTGPETKLIRVVKYLFFASIYIFVLNWLCSNNMCWMSWIMVISHIAYSLITIILIFSIINFISSMNYRYKINNKNYKIIKL
jgi:hypothetical protein